MKNKKILMISIIITIVAILIIGGITFAIAYTKTDMFKTDQQLFYKYFLEFSESLGDLKSEEIEKYIEKTKNTPYESKGKLSVKVDLPKEDKAKITNLNRVNELNITFSGKADKVNKLAEQSIKVNYSDDVVFPIEYKQTENIYGIKSDLILKKYVAVRNENMQELIGGNVNSENLGIINENNINLEKIENDIQNFKQIILGNLKESNFSKINEENFALILNERETIKIVLELLEELEKSENVSEDFKEKIKDKTNEIKSKEYSEEETLRIIINKSGRLIIEIEDKVSIRIQKIGNEILIECNFVEDESKINIKIRKNRR